MKITTILKCILAGFMMLSFAGCQQSDPAEENVTATDVTILLDVDKVTLGSANIRVRHTGAADMLWVYMTTSDLETPASVLIKEKLAIESEDMQEIIAYKGTNKSILLDNLAPKTYYRFICQSIEESSGSLVGEPSEIHFRTRRDPSVFQINENWNVTIGNRIVNNVDKMEYDNFIVDSNDDESYLLVPLKVSDFEFYYSNDIQTFFEDYVSDFGLEVGNSKWKDIVKTGDMTLSEQRLRSGEWFIFLIGIDKDGELTGYYLQEELTIVEEIATEEYNRWIGKWRIESKDGYNPFEIEIFPSENNMWYYMSGWESGNIYGYDTTDPALMPELYFDKFTGELCFISQYINTSVNNNGSYDDFYFTGTFIYGSETYVLGSEVLNYRMAEANFMDSSYNSARVQPCDFHSNGMSFPINNICYYVSGQGAISMDPPTLPITMTKIN